MERAPRTSAPTPDTSGWHYRDARGRACGPYDAEALARLYRFGHLRADSEIWRPGEARPPVPLRSRRDAFRLHGDGRLEALPGVHAAGTAAGLAAPGDASPTTAAAPLPGAAKGPAAPAQCQAQPAAQSHALPAATDAGTPPAPHAAADACRTCATMPATTEPPIAPAAIGMEPSPAWRPRYRRTLAAAVFVAALAAAAAWLAS